MTDQAIQLSIIIPVYNGAAFIVDSLDRLTSHIATLPYACELIIVDDGSPDATAEIVQMYRAAHPHIIFLRQEVNQGKGVALKVGMKRATGTYVVFTDADLPYGVEILSTMKERMVQNDRLDMVYGSRGHVASSAKRKYGWVRRVGRVFFSFTARWLVVAGVKDTQCGLKVLRQSAIKQILAVSHVNRFAFDIELFAIARANDWIIQDTPVELTHRKESSVHIVRDTFRMLRDMIQIRRRLQAGIYTFPR